LNIAPDNAHITIIVARIDLTRRYQPGVTYINQY